jgi:uncharacterized membrane protein
MAIAGAAVVALLFVVSAWAWPQLPPGATVPIHWNLAGEPDGYAPKEFALLLVPVLAVILGALFLVIPRIDPRGDHLRTRSVEYGILCLGVLLLLLGIHVVTTLIVLGHDLPIARIIPTGIGVLFAVIGLVLPRLRSSYFAGIRTPWTLTSERSWQATHRVGGPVFVALGVALAVVGLLDLGAAAWIVVGLAAVVAFVLLVAYSYRVWARDPDRRPFNG